MYDFYGHHQAYILDDRNQPTHAMIDGTTVAATAFERERPAIAPFIADVRAQMRGRSAESGMAARGIAVIDDRPSIVSVQPIVPSTERLVQAPGSEHLHVAVRHLDGAYFAEISERFLIGDVRLVSTASASRSQASVPLVASNGATLGHIAWDRERPGLLLIRAASPGLAAAAVALAGILGFLLVRLRKAALQLHASEAASHHLAFHDKLTGLPNRAHFDARLDEALRGLQGAKVVLHYLDLDHFKNVNDTLGHPAGDELIRQVATRLASIADPQDIVARLGGDEFAILQRGLRADSDAGHLAAKILDAVKEPYDLFGDVAFVDASIGIAVAPDVADNRLELVRKADIALYEAKGSGKGRICLFTDALDDAVHHKRSIERDLREALDTGTGLELAYQPIYAADGKALVGAEALVRWSHPFRGPVSPLDFIGVAEERGLIKQLGAWVLREACQTLAALDLPWIAVNVSAVQFRDPGFCDLVLDLLQELRISPERLQIEITESLLLEAADDVAKALLKLRFAGVRIALDDFGTGYSSLQYLHRYKVDKIKIDRSFVQRLGTSDGSGAIVRAMLYLASAFGLTVTAEGVETANQAHHLAAFGCEELQGFLLSPSKPSTPSAAPRGSPRQPCRSAWHDDRRAQAAADPEFATASCGAGGAPGTRGPCARERGSSP